MAWDKNNPPGTSKIREVDNYVCDNNDALEDALSREHIFPGTYGVDAGEHILGEMGIVKVDTKINLGTGIGITGALSYATDKGFIYRDVGTNLSTVATLMPAGTVMYFYQSAAPAGWTLKEDVADKVLAVKGGSQAYNVTGGSVGGTWTVAGLTKDAHTHSGGTHNHDIAPLGTTNLHTFSYAPLIVYGGYLQRTDGNNASDRPRAADHTTSDSAGTSGGQSDSGISSDGTWRDAGAVGILAIKNS